MLTLTSSADTSLLVNYSMTQQFVFGIGLGVARSVDGASGYGILATNYSY
jgi:hypothetical protein